MGIMVPSSGQQFNINTTDELSHEDNWKEQIYHSNESFKNGFRFLLLNANSIYSKMNNFNDLLVKRCIDMLIIEERKLSPDIPDEFYSFAGYQTFRRDRTRNGGGILILLKECYKISFYHQDEQFETIILTTSLRKWKVNFIVTYNPHTHTEGFLEHLESCLKIVNLKHRTLIIGDLNFDQLSEKGAPLRTLMDLYNFDNQIKTTTTVSQGSSTLIDVVF